MMIYPPNPLNDGEIHKPTYKLDFQDICIQMYLYIIRFSTTSIFKDLERFGCFFCLTDVVDRSL